MLMSSSDRYLVQLIIGRTLGLRNISGRTIRSGVAVGDQTTACRGVGKKPISPGVRSADYRTWVSAVQVTVRQEACRARFTGRPRVSGSRVSAEDERGWIRGNTDIQPAFRALWGCSPGEVVVAFRAGDHPAPQPQRLLASIAGGLSKGAFLPLAARGALDGHHAAGLVIGSIP